MISTEDAVLLAFGLVVGAAVGYSAPILWDLWHKGDEAIQENLDREQEEREAGE